MTEEDRFNRYVRQTLRDLDAPPPTPREEMWARIQEQRAARVPAPAPVSEPQVVDISTRRRTTTYVQWGAALAAMLVLGIGLGRVSMRQAVAPAGTTQAAAPQAAPDDSAPQASSPYQLAAVQHMQRTETLLTSIAAPAGAESTEQMKTWARELLTNTRLLLSSPAAEDPATRTLLEDLELVLSQVAAIPTARAQEEVELIRDGMNQSDVLLRLRAATTGPMLVGT